MFSSLALSLVLAAAASRTYVLETGVYEEITIDDGEVWLCVMPAEVAPCKIQVTKVPLVDGEATKVSVPGKEPLFLLKGTASVKPGKIVSLYRQSDTTPPVIKVELRGKKYSIREVEAVSSSGLPGQRLRLEHGGRQMTLAEAYARDFYDLVWAGDLDGDGRLDAYVRITHHTSWTDEVLFLSSADTTAKALTARAAKLTIRKME